MQSPEQKPSQSTNDAQYEFTSQQNRIIEDLAHAMRWVAAPLIIIGILYAVAAVLSLVKVFTGPGLDAVLPACMAALASLFFLSLGAWSRNASDSFLLITTTSGRDISHLMDGLDNLRKKYTLLSTLVQIYVALILIGLVALVISLFLQPFSRN